MSEALAMKTKAFETLDATRWATGKSCQLNRTTVTDESLMKSVINGDGAAFEKLIDRYQSDVYRYCTHFLKDSDRARDATQDVLVKAYRKADTFDPSRSFKPWLLRIARNLCLNIIYRDRLVETISLQDPRYNSYGESGHAWKSNCPDPALRLLDKEKHDYLRQAMARLSSEHRELVELRYFQRLCTRDIGAIVGGTEGAVRSKLHRALRLLRVDLAEYMEGD